MIISNLIKSNCSHLKVKYEELSKLVLSANLKFPSFMEDSFKYFLIILDIYFPIFDVTYIELDKKKELDITAVPCPARTQI